MMSAADINYDGAMVRWEPNPRGRLREAALALYGERGFENTTVAEIAERAGLTERTFFRHYADKREVLFDGSDAFADAFVGTVVNAPASEAPIDAVTAGLEAAAALIPSREFARQRQAIIAASPELQERELSKFASLATSLADALRGRGLDEPAATLTSELASAVFRVAFERWIDGDGDQDLRHLIRESLDQLRAVTAGA
jgi:AcrR family transcriptional regulator